MKIILMHLIPKISEKFNIQAIQHHERTRVRTFPGIQVDSINLRILLIRKNHHLSTERVQFVERVNHQYLIPYTLTCV